MLLIDIGNTRVKWAYAIQGRLVDHGAALHDPATPLPATALSAWAQRVPTRIAVANVRGGDIGRHLADWAQKQWALTPEFAQVARDALGVHTDYKHVGHLGVDRWLALLAVRNRAPVGVVGCGTAITIDVLDEQRIHRGGLILPGLALQRASLLQRTAGIRLDDPAAEIDTWDRRLGQDTAECVAAGTLQAAAGGIARSLAHINMQFGALSWVITGGDGPQLNRLLAHRLDNEPGLVLRGLLDIMDGQSK